MADKVGKVIQLSERRGRCVKFRSPVLLLSQWGAFFWKTLDEESLIQRRAH